MASRFTVESIFKAVDRVTAPVSRMQQNVGRFTRSMSAGLTRANRAISRTLRGFRRLTGAALRYGAVGVGAIAGAVGLLVREFSKIENAEAAFTPLLGGAEKARRMVQALNETAASTPFQFETLASAANQLLPVMNGNIEETIRITRMMGDTAGGNAQKLESITRGFTKAMLRGRVDMQSLNMIAEAGVPIFQDLADVMGMDVGEEFFKEISAGRVTTEQLTRAFEQMTGEGGKFFRGMEIASQTTTGMFSTLKDNISLTAAELGGVLAPTVKELIGETTTLAQRVREWVVLNREVINEKFLQFVAEARKALSFLADGILFLVEHRVAVTRLVATVVSLVVILKVLAAAMLVVNLVMMANPIGLIIVGIAALVAAVAAAIIWWDSFRDALRGTSWAFDAMLLTIATMTGPIGWLVGAAVLIYKHWEPLKAFFTGLWDGIVSAFSAAIDKIKSLVEWLRNAASAVIQVRANTIGRAANLFGFGGGDDDQAAAQRGGGQMVSPQERTARSIEERRTTGEVTIRDETGRAEETRPLAGTGALLMTATGGL